MLDLRVCRLTRRFGVAPVVDGEVCDGDGRLPRGPAEALAIVGEWVEGDSS